MNVGVRSSAFLGAQMKTLAGLAGMQAHTPGTLERSCPGHLQAAWVPPMQGS